MKNCKVCKTEYDKKRMGQVVCSPTCALSLASSKRAKAVKVAIVKDRKETRAKLAKMKSKAAYAKEAQTAFNAFIRLRDADKPCISCGRHHTGQYHAGHYLSVGARPELRFEESNVYKQCAPCNNNLSGNIVLYRIALVKQFGLQLVDWLESHHEPKKYTIEQLVQIKRDYITRAREMQQ